MPVNVLAPRVHVPSISKAAGNALAMRATQENIKGAQTRNVLAEKQLGSYEEDRVIAETQRGHQTEARAIATALQSKDQNQANDIYKSLGGKSESGVTIAGPDVVIDYGVSTIKGPSAAVSELMENVSNDPTWMTDPAKAPKTKAWMAAKGISFSTKETKQTPAGKLADQKELAKFKAGLKNGPGAVKKKDALKRISNIQKAKATLEKTDMVTQLLAKENPELAQFIGQKMDPQQKADLMAAWDNELDYLEKFSGTTRKKDKSRAPGEYSFTIEGGMQKVEP